MRSDSLNAFLLTTAIVSVGVSQALAEQPILPSPARPVLDLPAPYSPASSAHWSPSGKRHGGQSHHVFHAPWSIDDGKDQAPSKHDVTWYKADSSDDEDSISADFEQEFEDSNALGVINAQAAYDAGASGAGVIVGVVDEDFDLDHPELAPNIVGFADVTAGFRLEQSEAEDDEERASLDALEALGETILPEGHGTTVSGVIAAARDGEGIHGVAPEAGIFAVRADTFEVEEIEDAEDLVEALVEGGISKFIVAPADSDDVSDAETIVLTDDNAEEQVERLQALVDDDDFGVVAASSGFDDVNVAEAVEVAADAGSDIINLSLGGGDETEQELIDALELVTSDGVIVVASAGNDDLPNAEAPANLSVDPRTNGLMLAVGQVDEDGELVEGINRCGSSANQCLVALGEDVLTTENGGGLGENSGSSFSAPAVAGSLALLLDLFPTISSLDAVQILLTTATDLGDEGVDEVFGHGLVNLERAVQPVGVASLPTGGTVYGGIASLESSKLSLGGAFGDSFSNLSLLRSGLFVDSFRRPFKSDLNRQVSSRPRGIDFSGAFGGPTDVRTERFVNAGGFTVALSVRDDRNDQLFGTGIARAGFAQEAYERDRQLRSLRFSGDIAPGLTIRSGFNLTAGQQLTVDPASKKSGNLFLFTGDSLSPQHAFLGKGSGLSVSQDLTEATTLAIGFLAAEERVAAEERSGAGFVAQADLNHRFENDAALGFSVSFTSEADGFLGSEASGAFAGNAETQSQFFMISGSLPIVAGIEAFGSATLGVSDLSGVGGGLLSDLDRVVSDAFALGVSKTGVIGDGDRIGLMLSQPLRVENGGRATLTVPTAVNADGSIVSGSQSVNLSPSGRELNLQLAYSHALTSALNMTHYALARAEPGHDADADPDFGIGLRLNWKF